MIPEPKSNVKISVNFEPRDLWIGVYWDKPEVIQAGYEWRVLYVYVCIVPMFPIKFTVARYVGRRAD